MKKLTDISGVYASGTYCGLKSDSSKLDLAYLYVPNATASAGVFTKNKFKAACITHTELALKNDTIKAVIINSGCANAATGPEGIENCKITAEKAASLLGIKNSQVATASTGIIGVQLDMKKILPGLDRILENPERKEIDLAANAILTLDTKIKLAFAEKGKLQVGGFAKGAGMISPNMATMLGFMVTNVALTPTTLKRLLQKACDDSFNMISVDTDTSTNDMVLIISTGEIEATDVKEEEIFELIKQCSISLAKQIVADGEGAEKLIEANVKGANSELEAKIVAKNLINSPLVKTAIHGADPNWGRLMMAIGKEPSVRFNPDEIDVYLAGQLVFTKGRPGKFERSDLKKLLKAAEVKIDVNLNCKASAQESYSATAWGCDLTKKYIDINTDYN